MITDETLQKFGSYDKTIIINVFLSGFRIIAILYNRDFENLYVNNE